MSIQSLEDTAEDTAAMAAMESADAGAPAAPAAPSGEGGGAPAAGASPVPKPAAAAPAPAAEAPPAAPARMVPHAALHEERTKRQQLEREIAELRAGKQPQGQQVPTAEDEAPDEQQDPLGTIAWLKNQLRDERKTRVEQHQHQTQLQELGERIGTRVQAYAAEHPEYQDQVTFLRQSRAEELRLANPGMTPQQVVQQLVYEEIELGRNALQHDRDPGEIVAGLAKHRGWQPKAGATAPVQQQPQPAAAQQRLDQLKRGTAAAVSPSASGGAGASADMTIEDLVNLDGEDFDKAFESHGKRLMGG